MLDLGSEVLFTGRNQSNPDAASETLKGYGVRFQKLRGDVANAAHRLEVTEWITSSWGQLIFW